MKISGSILAVCDNYMEYAKQLKYANIDCLHIDIFEDGRNFSIDKLLDFRDSELPLDVHLIFENIDDDIMQILNSANISYLNIQYESLKNKSQLNIIKNTVRANFGIAYTMETPDEIIESNLPLCSQVLFMCSEPGISGAKFNEGNYQRIEAFRQKYPQMEVFVDGGIDDIRARQMSKLGVSLAVSGSFLSRNPETIYKSVYELKYYNEADVSVEKRMIPVASLPIVLESEMFPNLIDIMNKYRMGLVFVVNENKLSGIIADGDIRRGFLKYGKNVFEKKAIDLMNSKPYTAKCGKKIQNIYKDIFMLHKGIEVIPILNDGELIGALDLKIGK